jgi:hypothetical protein
VHEEVQQVPGSSSHHCLHVTLMFAPPYAHFVVLSYFTSAQAPFDFRLGLASEQSLDSWQWMICQQ